MLLKRLALLIPALALLLSGWLPFVNQTHLWFGLPSMIVWVGLWCLITAPILWLALGTFAEQDKADAETLAEVDA